MVRRLAVMTSFGSSIRQIDSAELEFSALADLTVVEVVLLDVFQMEVWDHNGLEKMSDRQVVMKFVSTLRTRISCIA